MKPIGVGLLIPKRFPRAPLLAALRHESRIHIAFETHDVNELPRSMSRAAALPGSGPSSDAPGRSDYGGRVEHRADVIVADMELGTGVRTLLRMVRARFPGVPVVMLDRAGDSARAQRARNLGVAAVLTRRTSPERFVARLLEVVQERVWALEHSEGELFEQLTPREWDILPYIARRYSAKEIAEELTISYATVRTHLRNIYAKCGVASRRQAVQAAESLLRGRYAVGDNIAEEVSRDDELRRRDGRSDPESERVQVHSGQGGHRRGQPVVRQQGTG